VSFSDLGAALRILSHTRELRPELPVIVRTIEETDIDTLKDAGAAEVVPEVVEGSLMLASHAMLMVGVPLARVLAHIREFRGERYRHMRAFFHGRSDVEAALEDPQAPRLTTLLLEAGAAAIGRSIRELGLAELRVEITAIRRRNLRDVNPAEEQVLEAGDVVILLGAPENLAAAEIRLLQG